MAALLSSELVHAMRAYTASLSKAKAVWRWYGLSLSSVLTRAFRYARSSYASSNHTSILPTVLLPYSSISSVSLGSTLLRWSVGAISIIASTIHPSVNLGVGLTVSRAPADEPLPSHLISGSGSSKTSSLPRRHLSLGNISPVGSSGGIGAVRMLKQGVLHGCRIGAQARETGNIWILDGVMVSVGNQALSQGDDGAQVTADDAEDMTAEINKNLI
ncbi:hypothetical protein Tco_0757250, partial [Tanacetum coccineum]